MASSPHRRYSRTASSAGRWCRLRNSMSLRIPVCCRNTRPISRALAGVMPVTSARRWGSRSITARVSAPKRSTIRAASLGPIPFTVREER